MMLLCPRCGVVASNEVESNECYEVSVFGFVLTVPLFSIDGTSIVYFTLRTLRYILVDENISSCHISIICSNLG